MDQMVTFRICTIVNNTTQYAAMRRSFEASGFYESQCLYVLLDNSQDNGHDPFKAYSEQLTEAFLAGDTYVIFCHQDILCNRGQRMSDLLDRLAELDCIDPRWAVAGNAGYSAEIRGYVGRVTDPVRDWHDGQMPGRVVTLDENFLVVRPEAGIRFSQELHGFHFYATDLCLQAAARGRTAYAIDFHLTHLSPGNTDSVHFAEAKFRFTKAWSKSFAFALLHTPCTSLPMSRYLLGRLLLRSGRIRDRLSQINRMRWLETPLRPIQQYGSNR